MLKNFFDFGKTKIVPTPDEILFFGFLEKNYGISAVETHFCKGKIQNSLHIWIDAEKTNKLSLNGILNSVDLRNGNFSLNCDPSNNELNDFAEEVINKYFSVFSIKDIAFTKTTTDINGDQIPKTALYVYDFAYFYKSYVYGHAINNIKKVISKKYKLEKKNILVFNEPLIKIIAENNESYVFLEKNIDDLKKHAFIELKKYDIHNSILENCVEIKILLKSQINSSVLNNYYMKG